MQKQIFFLCLGLFYVGVSARAQHYYEMKTSEFTALTELDTPVKNGEKALQFLEAAVFHYVNAEREKKRLKPLAYDATLQKASRYHSNQMYEKDFFSHIGKDPKLKRPDQRIAHFGGKYTVSGENIVEEFVFEEIAVEVTVTPEEFYYKNEEGEKVYPYTYRELAQQMVKSWMNSPPHKANILQKSYTHGAIGISLCPPDGKKHKDFRALGTQCFGTK